MREIKLKYANEKEAEINLVEKGIIDEDRAFLNGVHAVVWIGQIMQAPPEMEGKKVIKEATFVEGFHVDLLLSEENKTEFINEIFPKNPSHAFAGMEEKIIETIE